MNFFKQLLVWFWTGKIEAPQKTPPTEPPPAKEVKKKEKEEDMLEAIASGLVSREFINELRSIEPLSKQFVKARQDLVNELKKLAPR